MKRLLPRGNYGKTQISKQIKMLFSMRLWQDNHITFRNGIVTSGKGRVKFMEMEIIRYSQGLHLRISSRENVATVTSSPLSLHSLNFPSASKIYLLPKRSTRLVAMPYVSLSMARKRWWLLTISSLGAITSRVGLSAEAQRRMKYGSCFSRRHGLKFLAVICALREEPQEKLYHQ